jgi:general secretion pathway protein A
MSTGSYQCYFTYFGLRENPFHVSPDPRFYHSTPAQDSAAVELLFGLQTKQGLLVLTGEAGTGKTTLLNSILESLEQRNISTSYVFHSLLEPIELFEFILRDFGIPCTSTRKGDLVQALYDWLASRSAAGDSPVLIIDEAQSLSLRNLDELRLLLNLETPRGKLLQIILAGQSELDEKLRRPELRQLRQRVMFHCNLPEFSEEETVSYIQSRLRVAGLSSSELFPLETRHYIHRQARGIPRLINLLCEHALLTAYGEQQQIISPDIIQRIAFDFEFACKPISLEPDSQADTFGRLIAFPLVEQDDTFSPLSVDSEPVQALIDAALHAAAVEVPKPAATAPAHAPVHSFSPTPLPRQPSFKTQFSTGAPRKLQFLHRATDSFAEYCRSVGESFVSDCHHFGRSIAAATGSRLPEPAVNGAPVPRNLIEPIANWLRQPIVGGNVTAPHRTPTRTVTRK